MATPETQGSPEMRAFLEGLPPRYLRMHTPAEIQEHLRLDIESKDKGVAVSLVRSVDAQRGGQRPAISFRFGGGGDFQFRLQYSEGRSVLQRAWQSDRHVCFCGSLARSI